MRSIAKMSAALVALTLGLAATAQTTYNRIERPLYAGQHILVGKLVVEQYNNSSNVKFLRVTYDTTGSGWAMNTTHLYVGKNAPTRSAPGRFPFKHEGLANVTVDVYDIPLSSVLGSNNDLYIAAHADVCEQTQCVPDFGAMAAALPTGLTDMTVTWNYLSSYFNVHTTGFGSHASWCVDYHGPIATNITYGTAYHLSLLPDGSPNPDAIALLGPQISGLSGSPINYLNYLINRDYVKNCGSGGPYTFVEIQVAIWVLTNGISTSAFGANPANVNAILTDVIQNGANFVPGCGDLVLVVGDPQTPPPGGRYFHNQHFGFAVPVTETSVTGDCETAWARGTVRFSTGWGSYFKYTVR